MNGKRKYGFSGIFLVVLMLLLLYYLFAGMRSSGDISYAQLRQLFQQSLIVAGGIGIFLPDSQQLHRVPGFKGIPHHLHDGKAGGRGRTCPLPLVQHGVQLSLQRYGGDISL